MSKSFGDIDMNVCNNNDYTPYKKITGLSIDSGDYTGLIEIHLDDDYEYKLEMNKLFALKKKPKYPTTYEECCKNVFGLVHEGMTVDVPMHYSPLIINFTKLLLCRDAYWKIAGDWSPNWNEETNKFTISNKCNNIYLNNTAWYSEVLAFPTVEIRDAFHENFKDLIEQCKELL